MDKTDIKRLLEKFDAGQCTAEEIASLESWYLQWRVEEPMDLLEADADRAVDRIWDRLQADEIQVDEIKKRSLRLWPKIAAAASIIVCLFAATYFYQNRIRVTDQLVKNDVPAGGNKAYLILGNGQRITLTDAANGALAKEAGVQVNKSADGQLTYTISDRGADVSGHPVYNTIETPKGGKYQVRLPDGTNVWLNAASKLKFPASFANLKERKVELNGEAYFEVAHNKSQPFIVKTHQQEVKVLGTHFNVNSYDDEGATKTTLLEGAVLVSRNGKTTGLKEGQDCAHLKPGEQCTLNQFIEVTDADVEMAIAWKDGNFLFNDLDLQSIMKQLARWYDVGVDYSNMPRDRIFTGFISRDVNLSKVLKMLEVTGGIKFGIQDKTIKIMNLKTTPM